MYNHKAASSYVCTRGVIPAHPPRRSMASGTLICFRQPGMDVVHHVRISTWVREGSNCRRRPQTCQFCMTKKSKLSVVSQERYSMHCNGAPLQKVAFTQQPSNSSWHFWLEPQQKRKAIFFPEPLKARTPAHTVYQNPTRHLLQGILQGHPAPGMLSYFWKHEKARKKFGCCEAREVPSVFSTWSYICSGKPLISLSGLSVLWLCMPNSCLLMFLMILMQNWCHLLFGVSYKQSCCKINVIFLTNYEHRLI